MSETDEGRYMALLLGAIFCTAVAFPSYRDHLSCARLGLVLASG